MWGLLWGCLFPSCFVVVGEFDTRSFSNGVLRVVSNCPSFQDAFSTMSLRRRRCSGDFLIDKGRAWPGYYYAGSLAIG
jgi:hypothetical protein